MFTEVDEESQSSLSRGPSSFIPGQPYTPSSLSTLSGTNGTDGASSAELRIISKGRRMWNGQSHEYSQTQVPYVHFTLCVTFRFDWKIYYPPNPPFSVSVTPWLLCSAIIVIMAWQANSNQLTDWMAVHSKWRED